MTYQYFTDVAGSGSSFDRYVSVANRAFDHSQEQEAIKHIEMAKNQPGVSQHKRMHCLVNLLYLYGRSIPAAELESSTIIRDLRRDLRDCGGASLFLSVSRIKSWATLI